MTKILVETMSPVFDEHDELIGYAIDDTESFPVPEEAESKQKADNRVDEIKPNLSKSKKVRIHKCFHDELSENMRPCEILREEFGDV